jgi:hypothetical protein
MTYSYATRTWAITHMSHDFFGLQTIARAAGVKPRTLQSWFRQETQRAEFTLKMPREYERAMGIILLNLFPAEMETIADLTFTNPRSLMQWRLENRTCPLSSDLRHRTFQGVSKLEPFVAKAVKKHGKKKFLTNKEFWPDPYLIFERTWVELDMIFFITIYRLYDWRYFKKYNPEFASKKLKKPKVMVGPHSTRYTEITSEGQHFPLESFRYTRRTDHLVGFYRDEAIESSRIANLLLPPDWELKDKVVQFRTRHELEVLDKIYEVETEAQVYKPKFAAG